LLIVFEPTQLCVLHPGDFIDEKECLFGIDPHSLSAGSLGMGG
jgi:hypothetical protein